MIFLTELTGQMKDLHYSKEMMERRMTAPTKSIFHQFLYGACSSVVTLTCVVSPDPLKVQYADDILSIRAAVLYETCLRQLLTTMKLPVDRCTGVLRTGLVCESVAPFHINITSKGTAMSAEWVSLGSNNIVLLLYYAIPCKFVVTASVAYFKSIYQSSLIFRFVPMDIACGDGIPSL